MSKNFNTFDLLVMAERRYGEPEFMLTRNLWYDTFDKLRTEKTTWYPRTRRIL